MTIGSGVTQTSAWKPGAGLAGVDVSGRSAGRFGDSVRVTVSPRGGVAGDSSVDAAVEADITRSDQIGRWCADAFTLSVPAMPELEKSPAGDFHDVHQ